MDYDTIVITGLLARIAQLEADLESETRWAAAYAATSAQLQAELYQRQEAAMWQGAQLPKESKP
jgi:hypothetical protein